VLWEKVIERRELLQQMDEIAMVKTKHLKQTDVHVLVLSGVVMKIPRTRTMMMTTTAMMRISIAA